MHSQGAGEGMQEEAVFYLVRAGYPAECLWLGMPGFYVISHPYTPALQTPGDVREERRKRGMGGTILPTVMASK